MTSPTGIPVFDADNHLYETVEAFTRHLPARYKNAVRYVQVDGRTKIAVGGVISEYIPNPTFDKVARRALRRGRARRALRHRPGRVPARPPRGGDPELTGVLGGA